jgi:hypothetical protein
LLGGLNVPQLDSKEWFRSRWIGRLLAKAFGAPRAMLFSGDLVRAANSDVEIHCVAKRVGQEVKKASDGGAATWELVRDSSPFKRAKGDVS